MAFPVVTVAAGGLAVVEKDYGMPVTEATNGCGLAVTKVVGKPGMPVVYVAGAAAALVPTTFNPVDLSGVALSGGNLVATGNAASGGVRAVAALSIGKNYWEYKISAISSNTLGGGLCTAAVSLAAAGPASAAVACMNRLGFIFVNTANLAGIGTRAVNDIIGIASDLTARLIWFRLAPSGNWNNSGTANPATGVGGFNIATLAGPLYPVFFSGGVGDAGIANYGGSAFSGAVPAGFTAGWGV